MPGLTPSTTVVASVPASHVYVRHVAAEEDDGVVRLPDPDPSSPDRSAQQAWWPPVMLTPEWVEAHDFDVFHVHFGFDKWSPEELGAVVDAVHAKGRRFVQTVHDLRNPHHHDRRAHDEQLAALLSRADEVLTLTSGAAEEIRRRWGRTAQVVSHPHVVDFDTMARHRERASRRDRAGFRVGLHIKSLRPSMDPQTILPTLLSTVAEISGAVLQVNAHRDVLLPGGARYDENLAGYLRDAADAGRLDLRVHDYFSDEELWAYLGSLDVSVLPYRFGTHSGWLEACRDLGTAVVAPTCGYYGEQGPVHSYVMDEEQFDPGSLRRAVHQARVARPVDPLSVEERRAQRAELARTHRALYRGDL